MAYSLDDARERHQRRALDISMDDFPAPCCSVSTINRSPLSALLVILWQPTSIIGNPRLILWIWSHSEKNERAQTPDGMAKGIFMGDAVAALENETVKTLGSIRLPTVQVETLELKNIMNEIIPMFKRHIRSAADLKLPIFNDPADYQHQMLFKTITATRDKANNVQRWSTMALEFIASVNKPKDKSYWAAVMRALIVFD
jgi:hypothetical protein